MPVVVVMLLVVVVVSVVVIVVVATGAGAACVPPPAGGLSYLELPGLPAYGAPVVGVRPQPLLDALQVESVAAAAPDDGAVIAGELPVWRAAVERVPADAADVVAGVPGPGADGVPLLDLHPEHHLGHVVERSKQQG